MTTLWEQARGTESDTARIRVLEDGRASLRTDGAFICEREVLLELAELYERAGRTDGTIASCDALLVPDMHLSAEQAINVKLKLAKACFSLGLYRSFDLANEVFQYYRDHDVRSDRMLEATGLLVSTYELTGEMDECVARLTEALAVAEREGDIRWTCELLDRLGGIATGQGHTVEAIHMHERSLSLLDRFFRGGAVRDTMVMPVPETTAQESVEHQRTGELLTQTHYLTMKHRALKMLGDAHRMAGDATRATSRFQEAIDLTKDAHIPSLLPPYAELGGIKLEMNEAEEAARLGEAAYAQASRTGDARAMMAAVGLLHRSYKLLGDEGRALAMIEAERAYDDSLNNIGFRMGLLKQQMSYASRADSLLMALTLADRERQKNEADQKARRNLNATFAVGAAGILLLAASGLWYRSDRRRRFERFEKDAAVLETQALRSQMNPHFIFNALNSINAFVQGNDPDMASSYLSKFARVMRLVLENSRHAEVPLESDLEALRGYLDLERKRMRDKFDYTIDIDPALDPREVMAPPLLVQPFVENAIWHGMAGKEGQGHIRLRVEQKGDQLLWIIEDDGIGRQAHQAMKEGRASEFKEAADAVRKTSLGTAITRARLDLVQKQYGGRAEWKYVDTLTGTRVEVDMPMRVGS